MEIEAWKILAKFAFVLTFGVSLFLELFLGVPGALFVLLPHIAENADQVSLIFMELLLVLVLVLVLMATFIMVVKLMYANKIDYAAFFEDDIIFNFRRLMSYDFFTAAALFVMSAMFIIQPSHLSYIFLPAGQRLFHSAMNSYEFQTCSANRILAPASSSSSSWSAAYIDNLQILEKCCGWWRDQDWVTLTLNRTRQNLPTNAMGKSLQKAALNLPLSCCPIEAARTCRPCSMLRPDHFKTGCEEPVARLLNRHNTLSYGLGITYYLIKAIAYFTYCASYKEPIDEGNFLIHYTVM